MWEFTKYIETGGSQGNQKKKLSKEEKEIGKKIFEFIAFSPSSSSSLFFKYNKLPSVINFLFEKNCFEFEKLLF